MTVGDGSNSRPGRSVAAAVAFAVAVTFLWSAGSILDARRTGLVSEPEAAEATRQAGTASAPPGIPLFEDVLSVSDADSDGRDWYVLDGRQGQVHRLDPGGTLLASFGGLGGGPGEFRYPEALTLHGDTVVVVESAGGRVTFFDRDGRHLVTRVVRVQHCVGPGPVDVVSLRSGLLFLVVCLDPTGGFEARAVLETAPEGLEVLATTKGGVGPGGTIDPHFVPVIARVGPDWVFGHAGADCLNRFSPHGARKGPVCHDGLERTPVPEGELRELEALGRRASSSGVRFRIPEFLPPFDGVFGTGDGRVIYRSSAPMDPESRQLSEMTNEGTQIALPLPLARYVFIAGEGILLGWDELNGTRLELRTLPDRPDA